MRTIDNIGIRDGLRSLLLQVPEVVDLFAKKDIAASARWLGWLSEAESTLKKHNYPECARLAGLRSSILSVQLSPDTVSSRKKHVDTTCISTINPAQQVLSATYAELNTRIEHAYSLFRQILIPMIQNNLISPDDMSDLTAYTNSLIRQLSLNEQLSVGINGVIASIGKTDTMRVIADILTEKS